jgi:hypothetical protein
MKRETASNNLSNTRAQPQHYSYGTGCKEYGDSGDRFLRVN